MSLLYTLVCDSSVSSQVRVGRFQCLLRKIAPSDKMAVLSCQYSVAATMDTDTFITMLCQNTLSCSKLRTCIATEREKNTWQMGPVEDSASTVLDTEAVSAGEAPGMLVTTSTEPQEPETRPPGADVLRTSSRTTTELSSRTETTTAARVTELATSQAESQEVQKPQDVPPQMADLNEESSAATDETHGATSVSSGPASPSSESPATTPSTEGYVEGTENEKAPSTQSPQSPEHDTSEEYPAPPGDVVEAGEDVDLYPCLCARRVRRKYRQNSRRKRWSDWKDYNFLFPLAAIRECLVANY